MSIDFLSLASFGFLSSPETPESNYIRIDVSDPAPKLGETVTFSGTIESDAAGTKALTIKVYDNADDSLITTVFDDIVALGAGSNDLDTVCGGVQSWDSSAGSYGHTYYVRATLVDGATTVDVDDVNITILPSSGKMFGRYVVER